MILKYIPNILTISRLILIVPFLVLLINYEYVNAFYIYLFAGITDALDGWIARAFNSQTVVGTYIDPLADKLLITSSFITLGFLGKLPWWLVGLVCLRDLTIFCGFIAWIWFIQRKLEISPTMLSKVNTTLQLSLVTLCLFELAFFTPLPYLFESLVVLTTITTVLSYFDYVWTWGKKACSSKNLAK